MITWIVAPLIVIVSLSSLAWSPPVDVPVADQTVVRIPAEYQLNFKHYTLPGNEAIGLYGARRYHFLSENWFWGEFGYGALSGRRSGYLEGGVVFGYKANPTMGIVPQFITLIGAGGGGSAPQGGGFIINPTVVFSFPLSQDLGLNIEYGYMHFINGEISSSTIGLSGSLKIWNLGVKE